jgi:pimeloyl-ACP methyl ester carboxylesterase
VNDSIRTGELHALGLRTRILEAGPSDASEAIVCIHGGARNADDWEDLLPRVGAFARAVAFDLPGFGHADKPRGWSGYSGPGWALFVGAVLERLGVNRAHLVVNDAGGEAGLCWALAYPDQFASVVALNSGVLLDYRWHAVAKLHRSLIGLPAARLGNLGLRAVLRLYEPQLPKPWVDRWVADADWGSRRALLRYYRVTPARDGEPMAAALRELDRPALVIWGAENRFVPVRHAERQRESFPSADIQIIENTGHYTHLEAPERVAKLALPFLHDQLRG